MLNLLQDLKRQRTAMSHQFHDGGLYSTGFQVRAVTSTTTNTVTVTSASCICQLLFLVFYKNLIVYLIRAYL